MKNGKSLLALLLAVAMVAATFAGCANNNAPTDPAPGENAPTQDDGVVDLLLGDSITADGAEIGTDPTAPGYLSTDIIYYEDRETYDSGNPYGEGMAEERHTAEAAAANTVVNITAAGTYRLQGTLPLGQVRVDLGEEAFEDPAAVVTLILDGVDITCDVAPAILFLNVYECDNAWSTETASFQVDTAAAGANVIIADGSENHISGSHVARIYKDTGEEKKLWKQDAAFYSYMSMNVDGQTEGSGVLNITADNEGLDTELHLSINGGNINIRAGNDGINTNEDGVSVTAINGGNLHIIAGLGEEGDGIDSNGWLVINGGTVVASANPAADAGMDSDMGSYVNGGTVVALGSTMDWAESDSEQVTMNLQFAQYEASDSAIVITDEEGSVVFAYDPSEDEVVAENIRQYMGAIISSPNLELGKTYQVYIGGTVNGTEEAGVYDVSTVTGFVDAVQQQYTGTDVRRGPGGMMGGRPEGGRGQRPEGEMPEGMTPPEGFEKGERPEMPEGMIPPEGFEKGERPEMPEGGFVNDGTISEVKPSTLFPMQDKVNNFSGVTTAA